MNKADEDNFQVSLHDYYAAHGRHDLPWRLPAPNGSFNPYKIMVSELMLQQTQVARVIQKYHEFLSRFPDVTSLAAASLGDVLSSWSGLGYHRRAKFIWQAAQAIVSQHNGAVPTNQTDLVALPGIGPNTAGAILAYSFNRPVVFIETNIRSVYIHHFFKDKQTVKDSELIPLITATLDRTEPRQFYWMLMDYGSHLKKTVGNSARRSHHYTRQSPFAGSRRQIRGAIIRSLTLRPQSQAELATKLVDARLPAVLQELVSEGMIEQQGDRYRLS